MLKIGDRLREERVRLGFNQSELAAMAGVAKTSQFNYEKGERSPDAEYLAALAEKGLDVLYVVTGKRTPKDLENSDAEVFEFLRVLKEIDIADRAVLMRTAQALANSSSR